LFKLLVAENGKLAVVSVLLLIWKNDPGVIAIGSTSSLFTCINIWNVDDKLSIEKFRRLINMVSD